MEFALLEKGFLPNGPVQSKHTGCLNINCTANGKYISYGTSQGVVLRTLPDSQQTKNIYVHSYIGSPNSIIASCVSAEKDYIVGADLASNIYVWKGPQSQLSVHNFDLDTLKITDIQICSKTETAAVVGLDQNSYCHGVCFSLQSGELLGRLSGHEGGITSVTISSHSPNIVATGGLDGRVNLYVSPKYHLVTSVKGHQDKVNCIRFSMLDNILGSCGDDGYFVTWCIKNGEVDRKIKLDEMPIFNFAWSPDGTKICTVGADYSVKIVQIETGLTLSKCFLESTISEVPIGVSWTSNNWIVAATRSGRIWGLKTDDFTTISEQLFFVWQGLMGYPTSLALFKDQSGGLIVGDNYGFLLSFAASSGNICANFSFNTPDVMKVTDLVAATSRGVAVLNHRHFGIFALPTKQFPFSVESKSKLDETNRKSKKEPKSLKVGETFVNKVESTALSRIAVKSNKDTVEGEIGVSPWIAYMSFNNDIANVIAINKDKNCLVLFKNGSLKAFPFEDAITAYNQLWDTELNGEIISATASFDGGLIAVALKANANYKFEQLQSRDNIDTTSGVFVIEFYDVQDLQGDNFKFLSAYQLTESEITCIALDSRGTLIAAADTKYKIYVADIVTGRILVNHQWNHHKSRINQLKWSPSGNYLASTSEDQDIYVWSLNDIEHPINAKLRIDGKITVLGFPFETYLVVGTDKGIMITYDITEKN